MGCFVGGINRQNSVRQNSTTKNTTYDFYIVCKAAHPNKNYLLGRWHEMPKNKIVKDMKL
jgi:hypothetical protein